MAHIQLGPLERGSLIDGLKTGTRSVQLARVELFSPLHSMTETGTVDFKYSE